MAALKIYIAGPIAGHDDYNAPAFAAAAWELTKKGHQPVNPLEIHGTHEERDAKTRGELMRTDIAALIKCDGVLMLGGWMQSRGANLERQVAVQCGLRQWFRLDDVPDAVLEAPQAAHA